METNGESRESGRARHGVIGALALALLLGFAVAAGAEAEDGKAKVPRFVSLKHGKVHMRAGPGFRYPIQWVYRRRDLPVEVLHDYDHWRLIRDPWGTRGWIHTRALSGERTVLVTRQERVLRAGPDSAAAAVARLQPMVIAKLEICNAHWCRLAVAGHSGWLPRDALWGVYPDERIE